jgi:outer membrane protein TolC
MWMLAHGTRDILRENAGGLTALRQSVEGRVAGGALPGAEVAPARYEEARAALELSRADTEVQIAGLALSRAAGLTLGPDATPDFALLDSLPSAEARVVDPKADALEQQRSAALSAASAHRKAASPVLSARADAGIRGQFDQVFPVYRVGVTLELPLLDGGASNAAAQLSTSRAAELTALAREAQALADLDRARRRAELSDSETRIHLAEQLLQAAQTSHQHAQDQQQLGGSALEALVRTQARVSAAKLELLTARVARANAALSLAGSGARPASRTR